MIHLTVYGDGLQTRSFCHVSDEIEGVLALSQADEHLPTNIGNSREFTMLECAELVMEVTRSKNGVRFGPLPRTIPGNAGQTSPRRTRYSVGSRKSIWARTAIFTRVLP